MYVGSDAIAVSPFTTRVMFLEEGDIAVLSHAKAKILDAMFANPSQTIVLVTHRASALQRCTREIALEHGRIVKTTPDIDQKVRNEAKRRADDWKNQTPYGLCSNNCHDYANSLADYAQDLFKNRPLGP